MSDSEKTTKTIGEKTTKNIGWNYLSFGLSKTLSLLIISILAHILPPENFGLVALATLAIDYLSLIGDLGLGAALVQLRGNIDEASDTVFSINLLAGLGLSLLTFLLAPLAATFFREPELIPVLRWLGLSFTLSALGAVHNIRLQRELNFRQKLVPDIGNSLFKGIISISMALTGFGVWSLVIGQLVGVGVASVLLWVVVPWRPRLHIHKNLVGKLFNFGLIVMLNNALGVFEDSFDYLIIGRIFSTAALGIYTLAYRLPELLVINTLWVMTAVLFPAFSEIQTDIKTLRENFLRVIRYVEIIVVPLCIGMIIAAEPIIRVAFGEQWLESIPIMRILSLYALVISVGFHVGDIYKAIGRPDILLKISIPVFFVRVIALWIGAQYSLIGVAIAHLIAGTIEVTIRLIVAMRVIDLSPRDIISQLRAFLAGIVLIVTAGGTLMLTGSIRPLFQLVAVILAGAAGYIFAINQLEKEIVQPVLSYARDMFRKENRERA